MSTTPRVDGSGEKAALRCLRGHADAIQSRERPKPAVSERRPGVMPGRRSDTSKLISVVSVSKVRFLSTLFVLIFGFDTMFNRIS
jgi:hypothetical protein